MRILVAEDERDLNRLILRNLEDEGYAADCVYNGKDALDYLESTTYDVALLDVMMPFLSGFEVLERYRKNGGKTPVIFLTARDGVEDRVAGLDGGADDYIVKPFSFSELLARIRVVLRHPGEKNTSILRTEDLELDMKSHRVKRAGKEISLSSKEYAILEYMMLNEGAVLSRESFISHIWNWDYEGESNVVDVYIRLLRKKIDDEFEIKLIHTVRGSGYIFGRRGNDN